MELQSPREENWDLEVESSEPPRNDKVCCCQPERRGFFDRAFSPMQAGSQRGSVFTLVSGAVGAGVLMLPHVFTQTGAVLGVCMMCLGAGNGYLTLQVCCVAQGTLGLPSYAAVVEALFDARVARIFTGMLFVAAFGLAAVYLFLASQALLKVSAALVPAAYAWAHDRRWLAVLLSAGFCGPLSFVRDFTNFRYASMLGVVGILYLVLLVGYTWAFEEAVRPLDGHEASWWFEFSSLWNVIKAWSICQSAYIVHIFIFPVYAELANPTSTRMNKILQRSGGIQVLIYLVVALLGFDSFKQSTPEDVLMAFDGQQPLVIVGQCALLMQLAVAGAMMYHPARTFLLQLLIGEGSRPSQRVFYISTASMVLGATLIALFVPHIQDLVGFIGGFACITYALVLPALILLRLHHRADLTLSGPGAEWMAGRAGPPVAAWLLLNAGCSYLGAAFSLADMLDGGAS